MSSSRKKLFQAAGIVGGATFLSRVLGFVRDMVTAQFLGTSYVADAFFVAFRIPNLLRRLFGEGSLTASFIPVFSSYLEKGEREEALRIARTAMTLVSIILVLVTLAGICFSPLIIRIIAPGFQNHPDKFALTVFLNRIMFPYILLISLVALAMGILNSFDHFLAPALAPVLLNLCMIGAIYFLSRPLGNPATALAVGVLLGGVTQLLFQLPFLKKYGFSCRPAVNFRHPAIGRIIRLMGPSLLGLAITQITIFFNTLLASFLRDGSISYLYFADRLVQFPLGVFAVALGTAILPTLSKQAAGERWQDFSHTFSLAVRALLFITIPAMAGLIVLSRPIIYILFQRGHFTPASTAMVSQTLVAYAVGLWAFAGLRIIVPAFYSLEDAKTPVKVGALALAVNIAAATGLMFPLQHIGLALATSISSSVNCLLLLFLLRRKRLQLPAGEILASLGRTVLATAIMVAALLLMSQVSWLRPDYQRQLATAGRLAALIAGGGAVYALTARLLGSREMTALAGLRRRRS